AFGDFLDVLGITTAFLREPALQGSRAGIGLETAPFATATERRIVVRIHVDVADLPSEPVGPWVELASDHETSADTRTQGDHEEGGIPRAVTVQVLTQGCRRRVVFHGYGTAETLAQSLAELHSFE